MPQAKKAPGKLSISTLEGPTSWSCCSGWFRRDKAGAGLCSEACAQPPRVLLVLCAPSRMGKGRVGLQGLINSEIGPWREREVPRVSHHQRSNLLLQKTKKQKTKTQAPITSWDQTGCINQVEPFISRSCLHSDPPVFSPNPYRKVWQSPAWCFLKREPPKLQQRQASI